MSLNQSFLRFLLSTKHVREWEVAPRTDDPIKWDEGDAASPWRRAACCPRSDWYADLYGWVRESGLHQHLSAVVWMRHKKPLLFSPSACTDEQSLAICPGPPEQSARSYQQHILTHDHNPEQLFFSGSTKGSHKPIRGLEIEGDLKQVSTLINSSHRWTWGEHRPNTASQTEEEHVLNLARSPSVELKSPCSNNVWEAQYRQCSAGVWGDRRGIKQQRGVLISQLEGEEKPRWSDLIYNNPSSGCFIPNKLRYVTCLISRCFI